MSDMSFKQAKELVEKLEMTEISLNETLEKMNKASSTFITNPADNKNLVILKIVIALNIGFIVGLIASKYFL